jgi:hypothetical protein
MTGEFSALGRRRSAINFAIPPAIAVDIAATIPIETISSVATPFAMDQPEM